MYNLAARSHFFSLSTSKASAAFLLSLPFIFKDHHGFESVLSRFPPFAPAGCFGPAASESTVSQPFCLCQVESRNFCGFFRK